MREHWLHFAGVAGIGMSALAQFHALRGGIATGSDRFFDRGEHPDLRARLESVGIEIVPQDGSVFALGPPSRRSPVSRSGAHASSGATEAPPEQVSDERLENPLVCAGLVVSTAVEDTVPDVAAARQHGVPVLHRSELLAEHVEQFRTLAVTGTSGKSTVSAMLFEILRASGRDPSILSGAELVCLEDQPGLANVAVGTSDWLVIEADESDGSVTRYRPWLGLVLNLQRDHKEPAELAVMFQTFRERTRGPFLTGDDPALDFLTGAIRCGFDPSADVRAVDIEPHSAGPVESSSTPADSSSTRADSTGARETSANLASVLEFRTAEGSVDHSRFRVVYFGVGPVAGNRNPPSSNPTSTQMGEAGEFHVDLPVPGRHNVWNAVAAAGAALSVGVDPEDISRGLRGYRGVARRFQVLGRARGIEVIDDFAHNPKKIEAAVQTAQSRSGRVLAVFQPHGFGPTRFIRQELIEVLAATLRPNDIFWFLDIFYAGGTAQQDLSSRDLVQDLCARGGSGHYAASRLELIDGLAGVARAGDAILIMGARDPSLPALGRAILERLGEV